MIGSNERTEAPFPLILTFSLGEKEQMGVRADALAARPAMPAPGFRQQAGDDSSSPCERWHG